MPFQMFFSTTQKKGQGLEFESLEDWMNLQRRRGFALAVSEKSSPVMSGSLIAAR